MKAITLARSTLPLLAALLFATGCTSAAHGKESEPRGSDRSDLADEFAGDRDLAMLFVLRDIKTGSHEGRLRVQFELENTTPDDLAVEWTIEWKDRNGLRLGAGSHWQAAHVSGKGSQSIDATAPVPAAAAFQLQLRKPGRH